MIFMEVVEEAKKDIEQSLNKFPFQPREGYWEYVGKEPDIRKVENVWKFVTEMQKEFKEIKQKFVRWFG